MSKEVVERYIANQRTTKSNAGRPPLVDGSLKMYENGNLKLYIFVHFFGECQ